jgi:hypothetical protein
MYNLRSDTNLYKNTYAELIVWVKELLWRAQRYIDLENLNYKQAGIIMELEHEVKVMKEYGAVTSDVLSLDEYRKNHPRRKTGGGMPPEGDWLSGMVSGTEFLVRPKIQKTWILAKFMHAGARAGCVLVIPMRGDQPIQDDAEWVWVDPVEFCKFWELRAILLIPENNNEHNLDAD